jgi:hypothetical protein
MLSGLACQVCYSPARMPKKQSKKKSVLSRHLSRLGKKGGKARLQTMTEDERTEVARKAAQARWAKRKKDEL